MIGTNVLESKYDEIMAKPTPRVSGMNSDLSGSSMMNAGMNTDRMHIRASSRGTAVALLALSTAVAMFFVRPICTWVFSMVTVASSTRMPIASAMPPSDMMLIVLPVIQSPTADPIRASGMLQTTTITLRRSRRNSRIISPVRPAPMAPSMATLSTALDHRRRLVELEGDLHVRAGRRCGTSPSTCGRRPRPSASSPCPS